MLLPVMVVAALACPLAARLGPASAAAPTPIITTIAGRGVGRTPQGQRAMLSEPRTAAVDDSGAIWFTDTGHNQIRRLDPLTGLVTVVAGSGLAGPLGDGGPAIAARLDMPHGVAVDNHGHVYIADSANNRIRMVTLATGVITTVAGTGQSGDGGDGGPAAAANLDHPRFLVVGSDGALIVADTGNYRVRRVDPNGMIRTIAGTGKRGYSGDGGPATAAQLDDPRGLALDADGTLYISNAEAVPMPSVRRVDPAGVITTIAGGHPAGYSGDGGPATAAALNVPRSIALWHSDLYIADSDNNRIRHVDLTTGTIDTVVGTGVRGEHGDGGPATRAQIDQPRGVAVTPTGDLVIGDTGNNRLRFVHITRAVPSPPVPAPPAVSPPPPGDGGSGDAPSPDPLAVDIAPLSVPDPPAGYHLVASDGGIFAFGDAGFFGSTGALRLAKPIVGMAASPSGLGYWLVASDGGIFAFGDAGFFGSTGALTLAKPIVGMAASPSGLGYWLVASDGGIFAFGDAGFFGSPAGRVTGRPVVGLMASPTGGGYRVATGDGEVFPFGDARPFGSVTGGLRLPVVGIAG
jgi:sugar lactone lactonase YvrE